MIVAISASTHSSIASLVTAVPGKSLNVSPTMPSVAFALSHEARKPSGVNSSPSLFSGIVLPITTMSLRPEMTAFAKNSTAH